MQTVDYYGCLSESGQHPPNNVAGRTTETLDFSQFHFHPSHLCDCVTD